MILPTGVSLSANTASVWNWATYQLEAYITPDWATNNKIHWSASNNNVTVDENGLVTWVTDGTSVVTAITDYGGYTASCTFTVYTVHVTWVELNESSVNLAPWKTLQLVATISPDDATNKNVTRRSTDASVATVDSNWLVTCLDGNWWETNIIVTTVDGSYTATCTVKQWWWPWENTIAYFPLTEDFIDQITWNWPTTTTWDIPFTTSDWVICASCPNWSVERSFNNRNFSTWNEPLTWSFWCKKNSYSHERQVMITTGYGATNRCKAMWFHNNKFWTWWRNNDTDHADAKIWEWALYTWTFDWETTKAYINWELVNSKAMTYSVDTNNYSAIFSQVVQNSSWQAQSADWYYREVIMEDVAWTAEEVLEYYNLSKTKIYWTIDDYDELEYIESSGSQYIDTWVTFDTNDKLNNMEMYMKATHSWTWNFMWLYNWSYVTMEVPGGADTTLRCFIWNSSTYTDRSVLHSDNTTIDEITYNYTSSLATFTINWTEYTQSRSNWYNTWNTHLTIFARNNNGSMEQYLTMKMYSCYVKIWWEKVRDFMPARRKSDWVVWLYDKVEDMFYANRWSWTFTAWPTIWVSLNKKAILLDVAGKTEQLTATTLPADIAQWWFTWRSSDTTVATVNSSWLVTCVSPWECIITCTTNIGWYKAQCQVVSEIQPVSVSFSYTWWDQNYTVPYPQEYKLEAWWAGSNNSSGWYVTWTMLLSAWDELSIMVWWKWDRSNDWSTYWFWWSTTYWWRWGWGLSWIFTWSWAIWVNDSSRVLIIAWWAWGWLTWGWAWGWETWQNWNWWRYWWAWGWWTQTAKWSWNNRDWQFYWWGWSWTYWFGWGWWWRWWGWSWWDSSADDDAQAGWWSWYVLSSMSDRVLTQWWWLWAWCDWCVKITSI